MARPGDDVETEVVTDVEAAHLGHLLLQEGVLLPPQQQYRGPNVLLTQWERAAGQKNLLIFLAFHS